MTIEELANQHVHGMTGGKARAKAHFIAGAHAASFLIRQQLSSVESYNPPAPKKYAARKPRKSKPILWLVGKNPTV